MLYPFRFLLLAGALLATCAAMPSKLTLTVSDSNGQTFGAVVVFDGQSAFEYDDSGIQGPPLVTYDLSESSWTERDGRKITLDQARQWAANSRQRALASLQQISDPGRKAFTGMLLNPSFHILADANSIRLESQFLVYVAAGSLSLPDAELKAFFAYDELNAYRKAMVMRQAPPFPQLFVSGTLKKHGFLPQRLTMLLRPAGVEVRVETTLHWSGLSEDELAELERNKSP